MVIFDINGKKVLKVSLQMELDLLDKKVERVITARSELHKAISELFNSDVAEVEGWKAEDLPPLKATPPQTIKCSYCNTTVKLGNFCENCGKKLKRFCDCWVLGLTHSCGQSECPGLKEHKRIEEKLKKIE